MMPNLQVFGGNWLRGAKYSVRKKLMWVVMTTTLIALLIAGGAMVVYELRTYHETRVNDLLSQAELLGRATAAALAFDDAKAADANLALLKVVPRITAAAIYTAKGARFASYVRAGATDVRFPELPQASGYQIKGEQISVFQQIEENAEVLGTVYLQARYELTDRLLSYVSILIAVMAVSLFGAMLITAWLPELVSRPLLEITDVARQVMARRDFSLRVRRTTVDEIGYLVDAFNDMLGEIGRRAQALEDSNRALEQEMTERRGAEKALLAADQRKDEFLATLAHELRNPLAPLRTSLELLQNPHSDAAALRSAREIMGRQLRQLVRLVNDLLDISRITTGKTALKKERIQLGDAVTSAVEAVQPFMQGRGHKLNVVVPPNAVSLYADFTRLAQIFLNLLNNAAKFTETGGTITFAAEVNQNELTVTVTDTGIGISSEHLPLIFGMFTQADRSLERSQAGLGVGLTLVKHLAELHGGSIVALSEGKGRGSKFVVRLPVIAQPGEGEDEAPAAQQENTELAAPQKKRILLADDNEDFVQSLAMLLRAGGHEVLVVHDGLTAVQAAAEFKPEFAFLDIGLPKLNGYELARRLHDSPATSATVLVAVTGWGQEEDVRRAYDAGFKVHLTKPVELDAIAQILQTPAST
jgi:signal transduction histidine kinase/ActR/RegA family two-component response regulator